MEQASTVGRGMRAVVTGALVGAGYGVALRAWMRLVATDPAFTWSGTGYVVGVFTTLGATAGLVTALRRTRARRSTVAARGAGIVLGLGCFVAAGSAMLPTIVPAALGRARTDWPRWVRVVLVSVGVVSALVLSVLVNLSGLSAPRAIAALLLYLLLCAVEVELFARLFAPTLPRRSLARPLRVAAVAGVVALLGGLVVATAGLPRG